jgi:hypothetical protein
MHVASAAELGRTGKARLARLAAAALLAVLLPISGGGKASAIGTPPNPYPTGLGYWQAGSAGAIYSFGAAQFEGSEGATPLVLPIVDVAATPFYEGYWTVALDGGIFAHGSAPFKGSEGGTRLNAPVLGIASHPSGLGYWTVATDGGVFSHGASKFFGSMGGKRLNAPMVGIAGTPTGNGYLTVAADGGVFAFGDGSFKGSMGGVPIASPIIGIEMTPSGQGYWLIALDGGIFAFGDAAYYGATTQLPVGQRPFGVIGMAPTPNGDGYWVTTFSGAIYSFGNAPYLGGANTLSPPINAPIIAIAARPALALAADPFVNGTGRTSAWIDDFGNERLELTHAPASSAPAGARILGVESLNVGQLGMVGFTVLSGFPCTSGNPQLAIYADTNGDGAFDATNVIKCTTSPETVSVNPTTGGTNPLPASAVVTGMDVLYGGTGTTRVDNITAAGITISSHRVHTANGPSPVGAGQN